MHLLRLCNLFAITSISREALNDRWLRDTLSIGSKIGSVKYFRVKRSCATRNKMSNWATSATLPKQIGVSEDEIN